MNNKELINQYRNNSNKTSFFRSLTNEEKINLYNEMQSFEKDEFLNMIPSLYLKDFIFALDSFKQKEVLERLNESQIKTIYNNLDTSDQEKMASILEGKQIDLIDRLEQQKTNINQSTNAISNAENNLQQSAVNLVNTKVELQKQQQELKQNKIKFKKLEKERKKRLKKVLRVSKPNVLDRIGIYSKRRINKLKEATKNLEITNSNIDDLRNYNVQVEQNIENYKNEIEKEKQNIKDAKSQIIQSKQVIHENTKAMKTTQKSIKKLSKEEKRILGRKLYKKKVSERDAIVTRKKKPINNIVSTQSTSLEPTQTVQMNHQQQSVIKQEPEPIQQIVQQPQKEQIPENKDTGQAINEFMQSVKKLTEMGINFFPPMNTINQNQGDKLQDNPILTMNQQQLLIASYSMMAVYNYMMLQLQQQNQKEDAQNLEEGYQRQLTKGSRGIVNLSLLLSLILFIFSLVLFFIK